jgi:hypothetical protein
MIMDSVIPELAASLFAQRDYEIVLRCRTCGTEWETHLGESDLGISPVLSCPGSDCPSNTEGRDYGVISEN